MAMQIPKLRTGLVITGILILFFGMVSGRVFGCDHHLPWERWYPSHPIHKAVFAGDCSKVCSLLDKDPDLVNMPSIDGMQPLHFAIMANNRKMIDLLLSRGAVLIDRSSVFNPFTLNLNLNNYLCTYISIGCVTYPFKFDKTPLSLAIHECKADLLTYLAEKNPDIFEVAKREFLVEEIAFRLVYNIPFKSLRPSYSEYLYHDKILIIDSVLKQESIIQSTITYFYLKGIENSYLPYLMKVTNMKDGFVIDKRYAIPQNIKDILNTLPCTCLNYLAAKANNKLVNSYVAERNLISICDYLAIKNVNFNTRNKYFCGTLLFASIRTDNNILSQVFINKGARLDVRDDQGNTLLHEAVTDNNDYMIKYLLDKGLDINARNNDGNTPLLAIIKLYINHYYYEDLSCVLPHLIKRGADVNIPDNQGKTPLFYAEKYRMKEIIPILKKNGAKK